MLLPRAIDTAQGQVLVADLIPTNPLHQNERETAYPTHNTGKREWDWAARLL